MLTGYIKNNQISIKGSVFTHSQEMESCGAKWNNCIRGYSLPLAKENLNKLKAIGVNFSPQLDEYYTSIESKVKENEENECVKIINGFKFVDNGFNPVTGEKDWPKPHQIQWVKFANDLKCCGFTGDTGVGKTRAAIDSVVNLGAKKVLIVAPKSVIVNFGKEVERWSNYSVCVLNTTNKKRIDLLSEDKFDVYIINYDVLYTMRAAIKMIKWDAVIFDEMHRVKSPKSDRSKASYKLTSDIPIKIGLTATLVSNGEKDAFQPCKILNKSLFGDNFFYFSRFYFKFGGFKNKQIMGLIPDRREDFYNKLHRLWMGFRMKDIAPDMPDAVEQPIYLKMDASLSKEYKAVKKDVSENVEFVYAIEKMHYLRQLSSKSEVKRDALISYIEDLGTGKVIVWACYTETINFISDGLHKKGITHGIIDGRYKDRNEMVESFQAEDGPQVLVWQLSMSEGLNAPIAGHAVFYESSFSLQEVLQAKGRNRRMVGSEKNTVVYSYLLNEGTIDVPIFEALKKKELTEREVIEYVTREVFK